MDKGQLLKYAAAALLVILAIAAVLRATTRDTRPSDWYYDLSEGRLYTAPQGSIAPLPGIGGPSGDGVEAIVVAPEGKCADKDARRIAYLVTYTPKYKRLKEEAISTGARNETSERQFQAENTLVKRVEDAEWTPATSPEGEAIVTAWLTPPPGTPRMKPCKP